MTCRACKFLDVAADKAGRVVPRKQHSYRCLAPAPAKPLIASSYTEHYSFHWPPIKTHMCPDQGEGCPAHEARIYTKPGDSAALDGGLSSGTDETKESKP